MTILPSVLSNLLQHRVFHFQVDKSFLMKCFDTVSVLSQYGISVNKNSTFLSNKFGGIMTNTSSSGGKLKLLMILPIKRIG